MRKDISVLDEKVEELNNEVVESIVSEVSDYVRHVMKIFKYQNSDISDIEDLILTMFGEDCDFLTGQQGSSKVDEALDKLKEADEELQNALYEESLDI